MFSGKTTLLSTKLSEKSLYINHSLDTRGEFFYSHNNELNFKNVKCIKTNQLNDEIVKDHHLIGIDEAQFFSDINIVVKWVEEMGKTVYVAGLHSDYKREKFGNMMDLIHFCDTLTILSAKCECGKNALFSNRIQKSDEKIMVGSSEYEPVCRSCFVLKN